MKPLSSPPHLHAGKAAPLGLALVVAAVGGMTPERARAQQNRTSDSCAIYGSGFVAVQGSASCVHIGGRVRLDLNGGSQVHSFAPTGAAAGAPASAGLFQAPGAPGDGVNRARMNVGNRR